MVRQATEIQVTELQWLKLHLRVAALEQSGSKLNCRFEFPENDKNRITCRVYFTDDESKTMENVSKEERIEIYEGWVAFATSIIQRGVELAELPRSFVWKPTLQFILHENHGMGTSIVHTVNKPFVWPEKPVNH